MNSSQFIRHLKKQGCTFTTDGKGGHVTAHLNGKSVTVPKHGGSKQLGTGLMRAIKKQLGLP